MCPWLLSPGDAEETIRMFFALVRPPAVAMKKAPHCAGLFRGRVLGEEGGQGEDPFFAARKGGLPPEKTFSGDLLTPISPDGLDACAPGG